MRIHVHKKAVLKLYKRFAQLLLLVSQCQTNARPDRMSFNVFLWQKLVKHEHGTRRKSIKS